MKVGILTFQSAYNYGAVFQCYALNRVINKLGYECETIDYQPHYFKEIYNIEKPFCWRHPPIKTWIKHLKVRKILKTRNKNFEKFISEEIPLSEKQYYSHKDFNGTSLPYQLIISGSDQVWNDKCAFFDPVYFAHFDSSAAIRKASYAASFGFSKIPEDLKNQYRERLCEYSHLSVREKTGEKIIEDLLNRKATVCCDPTLLMEKEQWLEMAEDVSYNEPYILVYYVKRTKKLQQYAERIAKKRGLKVLCVPCNMDVNVLQGKNDKGLVDKLFVDCSPKKVLGLFSNAEMVLTNSFHGTVFSILFEKEFWVDLQSDSNAFNYRAAELLDSLHIEQGNIESFMEKGFEIDWSLVKEELKAIRKIGLKYLESVLNND